MQKQKNKGKSRRSGDTDGNLHRLQFTFLSPQCDSKHPRCTACANAGTPCHQEDRHRQTLTPRGYTERLERQLKQCEALLQRHIQGFDLNNLDELCAREGIHISDPDSPSVSAAFQFAPPPHPGYAPQPPLTQPPKGYPYPPPPQMGHPTYPGMPIPYPYPPPHMQMHGPPAPYNPQIHPALQQLPPHMHDLGPIPPLTPPVEIKGQDPQSNDMSNTQVGLNCSLSVGILN
jgi:hypothetical protein